MHEIPKILTEKEFAKRLQLAKETLNEYNCKNDIENLVYKGDDTDGTENVADAIC